MEQHQKRVKKPSKHLTLLLLNIMIVALVFLGIHLLSKSTILTVEAAALNVRTGPGLDYGVQTQVKSGAKVAVLKKEKDWFQVTLPDGNTGWVASWLIEDDKNTPTTNIAAKVIKEKTILRQHPSEKADALLTLKKNDMVTITLAQAGWSQVQTAEKTGWIPSKDLKEIPEDELNTTKKENTITAEKEETAEDNTVYTREMSTNIRKETNITSEIITTVPKETALKVLETSGDWYKVEAPDNKVGYVASWVVNKKEHPDKNTLSTSISEATIMLDAGHGGKDGGASRNDIFEKDLTLQTVKQVKKSLEKLGAKVILTRSDDRFLELLDISDKSNELKPDVFISIHYDATEQDNVATGTHTYYYHDKDKALAEVVNRHLEKLPLKNNGYSFNDLSVTRENTQPALLLELGYMSTDEDISYIVTEEYQKEAAQAITDALVEYFK